MKFRKLATELRGVADELDKMQKAFNLLSGQNDGSFELPRSLIGSPGARAKPQHRIRRSKLTKLKMSLSQYRHVGNKEKAAEVESRIAELSAK